MLKKDDPEVKAIEENLVEHGFCPIEKNGDFVGFVHEIDGLNNLCIVKVDIRDPDISSDLTKVSVDGGFLSFRQWRVRRHIARPASWLDNEVCH